MKQREDDRTGELAGLDQPAGEQTGKARLEPPLTYRRDPAFKRIRWGRGRQVGMRVGPYRDGRHYASRRARLRIGTGRTQAEFADRKSTRLNSSHPRLSRMPSSA